MFSLHKLRKSPYIDLLCAFIVYCFLEFIFLEYFKYFLWIPDKFQLLIPGTIVGSLLSLDFKKIIFIAITAPIIFKLFIFLIAFQIGFAPLYMEIVVYLSMAGFAFVGALFGYLFRKILIKITSSNIFSKKQGL